MNNYLPRIISRGHPSLVMSYWAPIIAIVLTLITGSIIFSFMGFSPIFALHTFFISPISTSYGISELFLKATPLALIGIGLAFCFKYNIYNIGAEGQLTMGAIFGGGVGIFFYNVTGFWLLPLIIIFGAIGGALWAMIPAILKVKFNTNLNIKTYEVEKIRFKVCDHRRNIQKRRSEKKRKELYFAKLELNRLLNLKKMNVNI